jgi:hypothetical protein
MAPSAIRPLFLSHTFLLSPGNQSPGAAIGGSSFLTGRLIQAQTLPLWAIFTTRFRRHALRPYPIVTPQP